jgi:hypothetical protein
MTDTVILQKLDDLEPESVFDSKLLKIIRDLHFRICQLETRVQILERRQQTRAVGRIETCGQ